ncbi:MAG TPA: hypothetical protein VIR38_08215 [Thalassobaculum sp.]
MPVEPEDETAEAAPKQRRCLRCEAAFQSAWAGERICSRCKSSSAWRQGSPLPNH